MRYQVHTATGLLTGVRQVLSPHQDARPAGVVVDLIVLHGISLPPGEFGGPWIDKLFTGSLPPAAHPYFAQIAGARVSAHVLIQRDGTAVQYVPFDARAWHAGTSQYQERTGCNDFSIGIEFEGTDDSPYEAAQYLSGQEIIKALLHAYPELSALRIVAHSDIAPGRKTDPGPAFDWTRMRALVS
jgi:AmpD protein